MSNCMCVPLVAAGNYRVPPFTQSTPTSGLHMNFHLVSRFERQETTMLNVLVDARMVYWSGVGRYSRCLIEALSRRDDVSLTLVGLSKYAPRAEALGCAYIESDDSPLTGAGQRCLTDALGADAFDILHCLQYPMPSRKPTVPVVVTLHDLIPLRITSSMPNPLKRFAYRHLNHKAISYAARIIAPSHFTQADIEELFPHAEEKIRVVMHAADDFVAGPVLEPATQAPFLFSLSNTRSHKNLELLVEAFALASARIPEVRLIFGGNLDKDWLAAQRKRFPAIASRMCSTGPLDDNALRGYYKNAQAVLIPSRYEGFGLPVLEAQGFGTPVIAASATSLPEVVGAGGLLLDPDNAQAWADAMETICTDEAEAARLRVAGLENYRRFSWDESAAQTVAVYRECLGQ